MEKREFLTHGSEREAERLPSVQTDSRLPYGAGEGQAIGAPLSPAGSVPLTQVKPDIIPSGFMGHSVYIFVSNTLSFTPPE